MINPQLVLARSLCFQAFPRDGILQKMTLLRATMETMPRVRSGHETPVAAHGNGLSDAVIRLKKRPFSNTLQGSNTRMNAGVLRHEAVKIGEFILGSFSPYIRRRHPAFNPASKRMPEVTH